MRQIVIACALGFAAATSAASAATHEIYAKAGFLGAGVGYAYGVSPKFTLRGDVSTVGRLNYDFTISDVAYDGKIRNDQLALYGDWFPWSNGFRFTAGLAFRHAKLNARGRYTGAIPAQIDGFSANDYVHAEVKYPSITPYIGIGWGHNVGQQSKPGWGLVVDVGVTLGTPKTYYHVSGSARRAIDLATGGNAQAEIDLRQQELEDKVNRLRFCPSAYIGISYTF